MLPPALKEMTVTDIRKVMSRAGAKDYVLPETAPSGTFDASEIPHPESQYLFRYRRDLQRPLPLYRPVGRPTAVSEHPVSDGTEAFSVQGRFRTPNSRETGFCSRLTDDECSRFRIGILNGGRGYLYEPNDDRVRPEHSAQTNWFRTSSELVTNH